MESEVTKDGTLTQIAYTYNASGYRTSKTVDGVTTEHLLDGANVAADVANGQVTQYVRGLGLTALVQADGTRLQYVTDGHGDVKKLVNSSGAVVYYTYDAFGNQTGEAEDSNPFRYAGEYWDSESGLIYLRARYYDSGVGGFVSEDPAKDGLNWYVYCGGNPVNFVDRTGEAQTAIKSAKEYYFLTQYYDWYIPYRGAILSESAKSKAIDYADRNGFYTEWREFTGPAGGNIWQKEYQTWDNEVDAYRHFTWNALMARELGFGEAAMVANTHELMEQDRNGWIDADSIGFVQGPIRTKMNQPTLMDLWNNAVGRILGASSQYGQLGTEQLFNYAKSNNMLILDATCVYSFLGVESYINTADWTVDVMWDWNTGNVTFMKEGLPDITLKIGI